MEIALQSAGNNRKELEKVLSLYQKNPADSLKYKAACFLIENMPFYGYSVGKQLENYKSYYTWLRTSPQKSPEQVVDSVKKVFGPLGPLEKKLDIYEIDSAYLCNNIEWAFKVWREQPWGKNISFDIFCEYLLPYRIDDEPLAYWREMYYEKYDSLLEPLRQSATLDKEDPLVAAMYLRERLPIQTHHFTTVAPAALGHIGPEYVQHVAGSCREATDFGIYLFRALGIPCSIDFVPLRGNGNSKHFWLVVWDKNGEEYISDFPSSFDIVRRNWWYLEEHSAKVYRQTFSVNRKLYEQMETFGEEVYPFWRLPKYVDVTHPYAYYYKKELSVPGSIMYPHKRKGRIAYLCLSSRNGWVPVDWTEYNRKNLIFRNIKKGAVMRVATYENGSLQYVTDPFYVDKRTNEMFFYSGGEGNEDVILYAKDNINEENLFRDRMVGGVCEGSNRPDFSDKDTLVIVQQKPFRLNTTIRISTHKKYRYYRYVGPPNSHCNISEISFYQQNDNKPLKGTVIGTPRCAQGDKSHEYTNALDGKTWTSFDYAEPTGGWVGLDVGKKVRIDRIVYTPRNRDNYIRPGDVFELFYCDGDWKSAGVVKADADSLVYRHVPQNVLLLLHNQTRGVEERIFVYQDGTQVWK